MYVPRHVHLLTPIRHFDCYVARIGFWEADKKLLRTLINPYNLWKRSEFPGMIDRMIAM